ncbi:MAG: response regulator [Planctomycetota bacterium]|nr:response regulator [Planctomycetota bacterium]
MKDGKYVILCVDDDPDILEALRLVLENAGYICVAAATAEEGLRAYHQEKPDVAIVDLMMEEVDAGVNLVKEIRAAGSDLPIYMLSSVGDALNLNTDVSALGLSGVFQKPLQPDVLLKTLAGRLKM